VEELQLELDQESASATGFRLELETNIQVRPLIPFWRIPEPEEMVVIDGDDIFMSHDWGCAPGIRGRVWELCANTNGVLLDRRLIGDGSMMNDLYRDPFFRAGMQESS
jgi:hypothetical protein